MAQQSAVIGRRRGGNRGNGTAWRLPAARQQNDIGVKVIQHFLMVFHKAKAA